MRCALADHIRQIGARTGEDLIVIRAHDGDRKLPALLDHIKSTGNIGHSFEIVVDPDNKEFRKVFGWDGDGADRINEILFNGERVE